MEKKRFLFERKNMYIYPWYISDLTSSREMKKVFGLGIEDIFIYIKNGFMYFYYNVDSAKVLGEFFLKKVIFDKEFFKKVIKQIYAKADALDRFCRKIESIKNISSFKTAELVEFYEAYINNLSALRVWGWIPVFIDGFTENFLSDHIHKIFKQFLVEKGIAENESEYYSLLSTSGKPSEVYREIVDRLVVAKRIAEFADKDKIVSLIKEGKAEAIKEIFPKVYAILERHRKNYEWLTYSYAGPVMSLSYLLKMLVEDFLKNEEIGVQLVKAKKFHKLIKRDKIILEKNSV